MHVEQFKAQELFKHCPFIWSNHHTNINTNTNTNTNTDTNTNTKEE